MFLTGYSMIVTMDTSFSLTVFRLNKCITYPQRHKKSYDLLLVMKTSQGTLQPSKQTLQY